MIDTRKLMKYFLEGLAVALAAFYIPKKKMDISEILMISITAGIIFLILDMFSPSIANGARMGAGLGIGFNQVGFENFEDQEQQ